jgi:hypothetical protein
MSDKKRGEGREPIIRADRPAMPESYGLQRASEGRGLLAWQWAEERLENARNYWISSTRPDGRPHAAPLWGVWLRGALYFGTGRGSQKWVNFNTNPAVVAHLESGDEVVILEGAVQEARDPAYLAEYIRASDEKYGFQPDPGDPNTSVYKLKPEKALGWLEKDFPGSATRWIFDSNGGRD